MTLVAVSTALSISITLLIITLVVVSALMILVVMMQRPKQEGLGAAFGGGMTDQLLGAGTTSFLQKATVILGILFFIISLVLGILVGRSNKSRTLSDLKPAATELTAAPDIASDVKIIEDGQEDELLNAIETGLGTTPETEVEVAPPTEMTPEVETTTEAVDDVIEEVESVVDEVVGDAVDTVSPAEVIEVEEAPAGQ